MLENDRSAHCSQPGPGQRNALRPFSRRHGALVAAILAATLATGCAAAKTPFGSSSKDSKAAAQTLYAGLQGLKVYKKPAPSSEVLGKLSLHQKVTRSKVDNGYAYVRVQGGKLEGWVVNSKLLSRVPAAKSAKGAAARQTPAAQGESATQAQPAPGEELAPEPASEAEQAEPAQADSQAEQPEPAQADTATSEQTNTASEPATAPRAEEPAASEPQPPPAEAKTPPAHKSPSANKPAKGVTPSVFDPY